jgi:DNA primase
MQIVRVLNLKIKTRHLDSTDQWKVHCPFHIDKTPSLFISPIKFVFHCFSCQQAGSLSSLYTLITGKSFYKDFNISRDEFSQFSNTPTEPIDYSLIDRKIDIDIQGNIVSYKKATPVVGYLRKRGISFDVADQMKMGYLEKGVVNGYTYNKRLTIPIYEQGQLLSIELRDITGKSEYKVFYPKDSTRNTLYDLDVIDKKKPVYVVEGLMDLAVLRTDPFFKNSTAIFGAGVTDRQIFLLDQFDDVILIPDNDKAGRSTVGRLKERLNHTFKILDVPRRDLCKDVGDIPQKLHQSVEEVRHRGWGRVLRSSLSIIFY